MLNATPYDANCRILEHLEPYQCYGDLQRKPLYSVQMRENTDQKVFVIGHFLHSNCYDNTVTIILPSVQKNTKSYLVWLFHANIMRI